MTSTALETRHPLLTALADLGGALDVATGRDPVFMTITLKREAITALYIAEQRLRAVRLQVVANAGDLALADGSHDAGAWLAHVTLSERPRAHADLLLGEALEQRWTRLGAAARAGGVNLEQAGVIARCLEELPTDLDPDLARQAETHLVGLALDHTPRELRILGRHVLEVIAPAIAEAAEAAALDRQEQRASQATRFNLTRLGDGTTRISGRLPDPIAARLCGHLDAFTSPRHHANTGGTGGTANSGGAGVVAFDEGSAEQRRGQAFCALLESLDPRRTPLHGGDATTLVVTVPLATLQGGLQAAGIVGDSPISAGEARRLACTATLIPAVLGGASQILDLGRSQRLFTPAQRKAMAIRDQHCQAEGCGIPAPWCEAHHLTPWATGGRTDLNHGVLLCSWHHHRIHDHHYTHQRLANGAVRFSRRT